jgi:ABC-2 type transport system permease protein
MTAPALHPLAGTFRYEFRTQIRRPAMWVLFVMASLLLPSISQWPNEPTRAPAELAASATRHINTYLPIIFGLLLADRLVRARRLNTLELWESFPAGRGARLWGTFLGAASASLVPLGLIYLAVIGLIALAVGDARVLAWELPIFVLMVLPGLLFVGAFSIVCTLALPLPLYAILFIGYWFWGNVVQPSRIPTLTCTLLTPIGNNVAYGLLKLPGGPCLDVWPAATAAQAWESIGLLIGLAFCALAAGQMVLSWRAAQG